VSFTSLLMRRGGKKKERMCRPLPLRKRVLFLSERGGRNLNSKVTVSWNGKKGRPLRPTTGGEKRKEKKGTSASATHSFRGVPLSRNLQGMPRKKRLLPRSRGKRAGFVRKGGPRCLPDAGGKGGGTFSRPTQRKKEKKKGYRGKKKFCPLSREEKSSLPSLMEGKTRPRGVTGVKEGPISSKRDLPDIGDYHILKGKRPLKKHLDLDEVLLSGLGKKKV